MAILNDYIVQEFSKGVITRVEKESIPKGAASESLNWLSMGDRIELRRGQTPMGNTISGLGKITGLIIEEQFNKIQVPIRSRGRKIEVYNTTTEAWEEVNVTDILPEEADGEDIAMQSYHSIAGAMVYASSPNSSMYKMMLANPKDILDQAMQEHRGKIRIKNGRTWLWDRKDVNGGSDKTGLYGSWIDKDELADFTEVTGESISTGDGSTQTFTGTLAIGKTVKTITSIDIGTDFLTSVAHGFSNNDPIKFNATVTLPGGLEAGKVYYVVNKTTDTFQISDKQGGAYINVTSAGSGTITAIKGIERSVMYVTITDTKEYFRDDRNGNLVGSKGGTGTINYATGAFSVTFLTAPANLQALTASYYWEDATVEGICDFSRSTPREAGEGFILRQDDGGAEMQNMATFADSEYCLHVGKTWKLNISDDDTTAAQKIYRERVGIPYFKAMKETGDGIYYVDASDTSNPFIRLLSYGYQNEIVLPRSISDNIDLSPYLFDQSEIYEWGLYVIVSCRTKDSTNNNRMLFYHKIWKSWDVTDYRASCISEYSGGLVAGDSASDNVFNLFDSFSDEDNLIPNKWVSGKTNLGYEGVKRIKRFVIRGLISPDQSFKIKLALDGGGFIEVGQIDGTGDYVDKGNQITIGSHMIGEQVIGGEEGVVASPYAREILINTDKLEEVTVEFEAIGVGYASISEYGFKDLRYKGRKLPKQYRV